MVAALDIPARSVRIQKRLMVQQAVLTTFDIDTNCAEAVSPTGVHPMALSPLPSLSKFLASNCPKSTFEVHNHEAASQEEHMKRQQQLLIFPKIALEAQLSASSKRSYRFPTQRTVCNIVWERYLMRQQE